MATYQELPEWAHIDCGSLIKKTNSIRCRVEELETRMIENDQNTVWQTTMDNIKGLEALVGNLDKQMYSLCLSIHRLEGRVIKMDQMLPQQNV